MCASDEYYSWYATNRGTAGAAPKDLVFHLCTGHHQTCSGAASLISVEHLDSWRPLSQSQAESFAQKCGVKVSDESSDEDNVDSASSDSDKEPSMKDAKAEAKRRVRDEKAAPDSDSSSTSSDGTPRKEMSPSGRKSSRKKVAAEQV